jgi:hypothetical protein
MLLCVVGWTSLVLGILSFAIFGFAMLYLDRKPSAKGPEVRAADLSKMAEAFAKLIDAFANAGPTISALIASMVFMGFAGWIATKGDTNGHCREHVPPVTSRLPMTTMCVVNSLPDPITRDRAPASLTDVVAAFKNDNSQEPKGCIKSTIDQAGKTIPDLMFLIGRSDRRQLRAAARQVYGDNLTVAYQRASSLRAYLVEQYRGTAAGKSGMFTPEMFESRIVTLAAGPSNIGSKLDKVKLSEDRCVEIVAYWNAQ